MDWRTVLILGFVPLGLSAEAVAAPERPAAGRHGAMPVLLADAWKSPVERQSPADMARDRWLLGEPLRIAAPDPPAIRWRLRGAGVKLKMPVDLP
ncbi:hypothetical protein [Sphingomonas fennica]|uniref:Uncharacterized protein n=1 Tax=Edaphosphingomonas fennica TaxID=114404 RepID=A0A2T4I5V2_9SPHN|nr:hypothetical protein [Sphingomonas fennica]PTD25804.1 hypothetical protein CV103_05195 [Sphingomonas fennica]